MDHMLSQLHRKHREIFFQGFAQILPSIFIVFSDVVLVDDLPKLSSLSTDCLIILKLTKSIGNLSTIYRHLTVCYFLISWASVCSFSQFTKQNLIQTCRYFDFHIFYESQSSTNMYLLNKSTKWNEGIKFKFEQYLYTACIHL